MKFSTLFYAGILSISISSMALAGDDMFSDGRGDFSDSRWSISWGGECGTTENYPRIENKDKSLAQSLGTIIKLSGNPNVTYESGKKISTWSKAGTKYQAIWNPKDPRFVRLKVIGSNGRLIANRLLKAGKYPPC